MLWFVTLIQLDKRLKWSTWLSFSFLSYWLFIKSAGIIQSTCSYLTPIKHMHLHHNCVNTNATPAWDNLHSILNKQHISIVVQTSYLFLLTIKLKLIPQGSNGAFTIIALSLKDPACGVPHAPWISNSLKADGGWVILGSGLLRFVLISVSIDWLSAFRSHLF